MRISTLAIAAAVGMIGVTKSSAQDTARVAGADTTRSDSSKVRRKAPATLHRVDITGQREGGVPQRPLVNHTDATTGGALDSLELRTLPTDGRDALGQAFTIPGVAQATGFFDTAPVLTIDGQNSLYTQYFIDGMDNNEGVLGGPRVDLPLDVLSMLDVRTSTYGVEVGRSSNGVVDYITRSGTDEWRGDGFIEGRPGHSFDAKSGVPLPDINSTQPNTLSAGFRRFQIGAATGGPLVRGSARIYLAGEYTDETQDQPIVTPGYTGGIGSAERVKYKGFARLDQTWSPTEVTTLRVAYSNENFIGNGGGYIVPEADNVQHRIGSSVDLTQRSGTSGGVGGFSNTASVQAATFHWYYPPTTSALTEPTVLLVAPTGQPEAQLGSSAFQYDEHELQVNLKDVLERQLGAHDVQVGGDMIGGTFRLRGNATSFGGFYVITDTGGIHQSGRYLSITDIPNGYPTQLWETDARPQKVYAAQTVAGAFAQDRWRVVPTLTVTYGVRWDYDDLTSHGGGTPDLTNVQPRASFNWAITPTSAVRGGAGIYAGKLPYTIYSDALQFGPNGTTPVTILGAQGGNGGTVTYGNPPSASTVRGSIASQGAREIRALFADGLKSLRSYQGSLGYQLAFDQTWGLSVDGVASYTFDLPRLHDLNADGYILQPGDDTAKSIAFGDAHRPIAPRDGSFRSHTTTVTGGASHYFGLYTTLRHAFGDNWSADLNWVWSHAQDNTEDINFAAVQANNFGNEWADAVNDRRHKIDLRSTYVLLDRLQLSGIFDYQTGTPINWISATDLNGSGPAYGDGFVRNSDRFYGVGRNAGRLPDAYYLNLGLSYLISFAGHQGVELHVDVFNVFNRVNESGFPSGLAGIDPRTQIGRPGDPITFAIAGPPRQTQFYARYHF